MKTDMELRNDVEEELSWDPGVKAAEIGVSVKDGVVTLSGTVDSYAEKCEAERVALRVAGVKALAAEIEVKLPGGSVRTDADLARAAENALLWDVMVPEDKIKVIAENGWITLTGEVDYQYQKQWAESPVRRLTGVKGISNKISVKLVPTPIEIKTRIERALERRADVNAQHITVETDGGNVTLSGMVLSAAEREAAERAAWSAPGVYNVDDRIAIGL